MSTSIRVNDNNDDSSDQQYQSLLNNTHIGSRISGYSRQRLIRIGAITFFVLLLLFIFYKLGQYSRSGYAPSKGDKLALAIQTQANVTQLMTGAIDASVDPCSDFYQFACGGWLASDSAVIPDDKSSIDLVMHAINEETTATLRSILESSTQWPVISEFYRLCMDTSAIDKAGVPDTLTRQLRQIDQLTVAAQELNNTMPYQLLFNLIGQLHLQGTDAVFSFNSGADIMEPLQNIGQLTQSGLALPDITYYTATDADSTALLQQYRQHISQMMQLVGGYAVSLADTYADQALQFETTIAQNSQPEVELRNVTATYNKISFDDLLQLTQSVIPNIAMMSYFQTLQLWPVANQSPLMINVQSIRWLTQLCTIIQETSVEQLQSYLRWHAIHAVASLLSAQIADAQFAFFSTKLNGITVQQPRYKQCIRSTDAYLGQMLGRYYVERAFDADSKKLASKMMQDVVDAMDSKLNSVRWLDESTRSKAVNKLSMLQEQIGFPDKWEQYVGLDLAHSSFYNDVLTVRQWAVQRDIARVSQPVDRNLWEMTTPTINAYYEPSMNHIVLPAGILTGLYFNKLYHPAINYGGTATTQGHELTHAFDDQGAQFDGSGKFENWWSDSVQTQWTQRTQCIADWYSQYEVLPGLKLDGQLTCGENIADVGGIKQSYNSYQSFMNSGDAGVEGIDVHSNYIDQYSNDQLFFIAYAQGWCSINRPELARIRVLTDPHSDSRSRVNGPVSMFPEFGRTFNCKAGDAMMPQQERLCDVW